MRFLSVMAKGAVIGIGMIIPGVSGGTLAVLLGIYEELILRISTLKSNFKAGIQFLFPLVLGMILAFAAMYYPLKLALEHIPFELCMIFVGLMICSTPKIGIDAYHSGFHKLDILFLLLAFGLCLGLCFIPIGEDLELNLKMPWYMFPSLFLVGFLASVALVVPGISGSMILLVIGFYKPLLDAISHLFSTPLDAFVILLLFAVGLVIGFFTIAKLMRHLLEKYENQTKWAILGFVLASILALFFAIDYKDTWTAMHIGIGCGCFILIVFSYCGFYFLFFKKWKEKRKSFLEQE
ncbi:MAG: DUF368 domain-containing protein [Anaeroplasmataceae bacterium]|nr:DUF368 domain-containing protein [Anaeroplasmataceae bacterium]